VSEKVLFATLGAGPIWTLKGLPSQFVRDAQRFADAKSSDACRPVIVLVVADRLPVTPHEGANVARDHQDRYFLTIFDAAIHLRPSFSETSPVMVAGISSVHASPDSFETWFLTT
jgi:hypothetical protein